MSQDMHKAASKYSKVLLDNDNVRVVELNWKKGLKIEMHAHPKYFAYGLIPVKYKSTSPDGKTRTRSMKKGQLAWYEPESHSVESTGTTGKAIIVELK